MSFLLFFSLLCAQMKNFQMMMLKVTRLLPPIISASSTLLTFFISSLLYLGMPEEWIEKNRNGKYSNPPTDVERDEVLVVLLVVLLIVNYDLC